MTVITNNFSFPVILADRRDANVSWQHHLNRGSAGGVDLAYPFGAVVLSPADGVFRYIAGTGSGGNIGQVRMDDGRIIELMHLSAPIARSGARVSTGQQLAKSGASGFGKPNYYAPHLHVHLITAGGTRVNIFNYFGTPLPKVVPDGTMEADSWKRAQAWLKGSWGFTGAVDGSMEKDAWMAMQRFLKAKWGYLGVVDGVMGVNSYKAMQRWLKTQWGYKGLVDGLPGPMTWTSFQNFLNSLSV